MGPECDRVRTSIRRRTSPSIRPTRGQVAITIRGEEMLRTSRSHSACARVAGRCEDVAVFASLRIEGISRLLWAYHWVMISRQMTPAVIGLLTGLLTVCSSQSQVLAERRVTIREGVVATLSKGFSLERFDAIVRIDPPPKQSGKPFRGVWLNTGKQRLLVAYVTKDLLFWGDFADQRVRVHGQRYYPRAQAIQAKHFRVLEMEIVGAHDYQTWSKLSPLPRGVTSIGREQVLRGRFVQQRIGSGQKGAGTVVSRFVGPKGRNYILMGKGRRLRGRGEVRGREVTVTPFWAATVGGPRFFATAAVALKRSNTGVR